MSSDRYQQWIAQYVERCGGAVAGAVVDPTAAQFTAIDRYVPWQPGDPIFVGYCQHCGAGIHSIVQSLDEAFTKLFCSGACTRGFYDACKKFADDASRTELASKLASVTAAPLTEWITTLQHVSNAAITEALRLADSEQGLLQLVGELQDG